MGALLMDCFVAGRVKGRECYGRMTEHHVISRDRLHAFFGVPKKGPGSSSAWFRAIVADPRNKKDACFGCHIGLIETGNPAAQVQPVDLPDGFWSFVAEHNLWGQLPRHLQGHVPAAEAA
jgi:hypothetical protein